MRKKSGLALAMALLMLLCLALPAPAERLHSPAKPGKQRLRALLIGCDYFVSQPDTWPAAENNLQLLADTLQMDNRHYSLIRSISGSISTVDAFRDAVRSAFSGARAEDVSLLYISTHGIFDEGASNLSAALLLSDGAVEEKLFPQTLRDMMDAVPGVKLLILDACNAGAFIGKGMADPASPSYFTGSSYKVLCSAGGGEKSWYWKSEDDGDPNIKYGASYFATVLADALARGGAADENADGSVSLYEIDRYLRTHYAASTPQTYPEADRDFVFFRPGPAEETETPLVTDLTLDSDVMLPGEDLTFTYTLHRSARVYYQLIYQRRGRWDFNNAQMFSDSELTDGDISPGRRSRTLSLGDSRSDTAGYVILVILTKENDRPVLHESRLLCVQPASSVVELSLRTADAFCPALGEELNVWVGHNVPCSLRVTVRDTAGSVVRRIAWDLPSRPQGVGGSTFCWDGRKNNGEMAGAGNYILVVQTETGGRGSRTLARTVTLTAPEDGAAAAP